MTSDKKWVEKTSAKVNVLLLRNKVQKSINVLHIFNWNCNNQILLYTRAECFAGFSDSDFLHAWRASWNDAALSSSSYVPERSPDVCKVTHHTWPLAAITAYIVIYCHKISSLWNCGPLLYAGFKFKKWPNIKNPALSDLDVIPVFKN